jgi:hypothetical protein
MHAGLCDGHSGEGVTHRTVGPSCRANTRSAEATASGSVVNGFCTDVTLSPVACNRAITSDQHDPSANQAVNEHDVGSLDRSGAGGGGGLRGGQ